MDCEVCEEIFAKIKEIDSKIGPLELEKVYYENRLSHIIIAGVHKDTIQIIQERLEMAIIEWMNAKAKQQKRHK